MDKEEQLKVLKDIIAMPSVNDGEAEVAEYFKQLFNDHGIESHLEPIADGRANLIADLKGNEDGKLLVYSGHADVVSAGDESAWDSDPFTLTQKDGKLIGRGVSDMKAGLAAMALGMIDLKESQKPFKGTVRFILTVGEESKMAGSTLANANGDMTGADGLLISEPSSGKIVTNHMGSYQYRIVATGASAHSSTPELGINALNLLREVMDQFEERLNQAAGENVDPYLGQTFNVYTMMTAGNQVNSIPEQAVLTGNVRAASTYDNDHVNELLEDVVKQVQSHTKGKLTLEVFENAMPVQRDTDSELVKVIQAVSDHYVSPWIAEKVAQASGAELEELKKLEANPQQIKHIPGVTDASFLLKDAPDTDFAMFGPGLYFQAHQTNEYMYEVDYYAFIDFYRRIAEKYLQ
ncbi:MAG: ArgE/DapE family deacylase [Aerococcus sp.]|nr:ArgE/DapE family deacylase [Aerococcus sp.]